MKIQLHLLLLSLSLLFLPTQSTSLSLSTLTTTTTESKPPTVPNANHIFNTLTSALRQWGSSWNHNGMSIFRATVPANVLLYHGRGNNETVKGMEWLAFEAEHAMMFARRMGPPSGDGRGRRPGGGRGRDGEGKGREKEKGVVKEGKGKQAGCGSTGGQHVISEINEEHSELLSLSEHPELRRRSGHRHKPTDNNEDQDEIQGGYLHYYRTTHDLNLLYIDGQSAGKTRQGTLDTQDYLLLGRRSNDSGMPFDELDRAVGLCNLTRTVWDRKIDGFIRMECGFEILLCEFEGNVRHERMQMAKNEWIRSNVTEETRHIMVEAGFRIYRAVSDRFWGIGGNRAEVSFGDGFVTAYSRGELDLFEKVVVTGEMLPRLRNVSGSALEDLKDEVTEMVQRPVERDAVDWQKVSDMYVQRYAGPLQALLLPDLEMADFRRQLEFLLWVFASDSWMGKVVEGTARMEVTARCTDQFLPIQWNNSLAGRAVQHVGSQLCGTLADLLFNLNSGEADSNDDDSARYMMARQELSRLVSWLDWPIWRYCSPGCAANEVCVLPIWPITTGIEDRKKPNCKNASMLATEAARGFNDSYWHTPGELTRPPRRRPHEGEPSQGHQGPIFLD